MDAVAGRPGHRRGPPGLSPRHRSGSHAGKNSVSIKVVNQPDMDTTTRIETDGTISFPYVGRIRAAGLTEDQVAHAIERQLASRQIVTDPHVLARHHQLRHASERPGAGRGARSVHSGSANQSHATSVPRGRDCGTPPWVERCLCAAPAARSGKFDSTEVQAGRGPRANLRIANNDEVFVDLAPYDDIYGYVGKAGEYPLLRPITVQQAISIGGGLAVLGSEWRIKIKRKSGNGQTYEVPASLDDQVVSRRYDYRQRAHILVIKCCYALITS